MYFVCEMAWTTEARGRTVVGPILHPHHDLHSLLLLLCMSHYIARVRNFKIEGLLYIIHIGPNVVHMGPLK